MAAWRAIEHLRLVPVMFELGARHHPPRDLYRAYLEQSDVFIGLYPFLRPLHDDLVSRHVSPDGAPGAAWLVVRDGEVHVGTAGTIDEVFVPDAAVSLTRPADVWAPIWNIVMGVAMPLIMSVYVGAADAAVEVVKNRLTGTTDRSAIAQIGEMLNSHQTASDLLDAMYGETQNLEFALSDEMSARILSRKSVVAESVVDTLRHAVALVGGNGYSRGCTVERLMRDVLASHFHPLPRGRQVELTGRVAMGLPRV